MSWFRAALAAVALAGSLAACTVTPPAADGSAVPSSTVAPAPTVTPSSDPAAPTSAQPAPPAASPGPDPTQQTMCGGPGIQCVTADLTKPLTIKTANTVVDGGGHHVPGISVQADGVTVRNFVVVGAAGIGIRAQGNDLLIEHNDISQVSKTDDLDAMRFFGNRITIRANRTHDLIAGLPGDAHVDCMQTYALGISSSDVVIEGNRCEGVKSQCLMAEGQGSTDYGSRKGSGGASQRFTIRNNYFACGANQAVALRDLHGVLLEGNDFTGSTGAKAVQSADRTDGVTFAPSNVLREGMQAVGD